MPEKQQTNNKIARYIFLNFNILWFIIAGLVLPGSNYNKTVVDLKILGLITFRLY
jgi:hypothetical protein